MMNRLRWRFRIGILATMALAILLTGPMAALADKSSDGFIVKDEPMGKVQMLESFAAIELKNGDEIVFAEVPDERGRIGGVLVTETRSEDRASMRSVEGLRDANPLEIFNAYAEPQGIVPAILVKLYGRDSSLGQQGWARDMVVTGDPSLVSCPAAGDWGDDLAFYADAFNHDNPFKSTWDGPSTKPQHWAYIGSPPADGKPYYELNGQANDVTAFYSSVLYCVEDYDNASTYNGSYVGNYVSFDFRPAGHGGWIFSQQKQLDDVGDRIDHLYYPGNLFSPSAAKYDFHLEIYMAKPADEFHIGATWVYGGPSDFKSPS